MAHGIGRVGGGNGSVGSAGWYAACRALTARTHEGGQLVLETFLREYVRRRVTVCDYYTHDYAQLRVTHPDAKAQPVALHQEVPHKVDRVRLAVHYDRITYGLVIIPPNGS